VTRSDPLQRLALCGDVPRAAGVEAGHVDGAPGEASVRGRRRRGASASRSRGRRAGPGADRRWVAARRFAARWMTASLSLPCLGARRRRPASHRPGGRCGGARPRSRRPRSAGRRVAPASAPSPSPRPDSRPRYVIDGSRQ
jgi:hypothetical protein